MPSADTRPGVVMVDDNPRRRGQQTACLTSTDIRWLGWTSEPSVALAMAVREAPVVVLLDVDMPLVTASLSSNAFWPNPPLRRDHVQRPRPGPARRTRAQRWAHPATSTKTNPPP